MGIVNRQIAKDRQRSNRRRSLLCDSYFGLKRPELSRLAITATFNPFFKQMLTCIDLCLKERFDT